MTQDDRDLPCSPEHLPEQSMDPADWEEFRALAHQALDDAVNFLAAAGERPVWKAVPDEVKAFLREDVPMEPQPLDVTYQQLRDNILPYATGNVSPRFWGWVHGTGLASGLISELMAAAMNSNCGGRDHGAPYVEAEVLEWCRQIFSFPETTSGILVSGTSVANLVALTTARDAMSANMRRDGVRALAKDLVGYTSSEAHESLTKAFDILGLGAAALRSIPVDSEYRMDVAQLPAAIAEDKRKGLQPFCVIGCAGTVNTGAIDDLETIAQLCAAENLWFHVDGAFGALGVLDESLRPLLKGMERADSLAFDFHKWMYVQYDAGCVLVRNGELHRQAFSMRPAYLQGSVRGLAGGERWFCDYGPELSRGFRALKIWFAMKHHGVRRFGRAIRQNVDQARYLVEIVDRRPELELLSQSALNIVCFRYVKAGVPDSTLNQVNQDIVADLQEQGIAAPSTTTLRGKTAIRAAITNHRSRREDFDALIEAVVRIGSKKV